MEYADFIEKKRHSSLEYGIKDIWVPDTAFDFQREAVRRAVQKGRMGVFGDTGLGKTLIQLSIANSYIKALNCRVLIITPIAVGFQFIQEAERIGIDDIEQTKDGSYKKKIVVINYERLHMVEPTDFDCVILDESSILKNFDGAIKGKITSFIKKVKYRYLSTATPSPNDFIELGTSAEALGYMGHMDMLTKFFKSSQNSVDSNNRNIGEKFYLKPHAERDFFAWVNSWAMMFKKPSDLGEFDDSRYILPSLIKNTHTVINESLIEVGGQAQMFNIVAQTMTEVRHEQKATVEQRCSKAVELADGKTSVYWCNLNEESSRISEIDPIAVEVRGDMSLDKKEGVLVDFASGNIERIITKAKMTGMGLNWQHCNHSVFFPSWSYEQFYQSIRRFWRFGQTEDVTIDIVISDGQTRVMQAIDEKQAKAEKLYENLIESVNRPYIDVNSEFNADAKLPRFLQ